MHTHNVNFAWYEAGGDFSDQLLNQADVHSTFQSPSWTSQNYVKLRDSITKKEIPYSMPKAAGGMTTHYEGVSYYTEDDIISSLSLNDIEKQEILGFVHNYTKVHCDIFEDDIHTHDREANKPAVHDGFVVLPQCMYGKCRGSSCALNKYWWTLFSSVTKSELNDWYKNSAFIEFASPDLMPSLYSEVSGLIVKDKSAQGVMVKQDTRQFLSCARYGVLLASGVFGNARLLLDVVPQIPFFAQPVSLFMDTDVVYSSNDVCDTGTHTGGTAHMTSLPGFLATFAACQVDGQTRVVYSAALAVNSKINGTMFRENSTVVAEVNYGDESIKATLRNQFLDAITSRFGNASQLSPVSEFEYASYHYTAGVSDLVHASKFTPLENVYLADASAVTGHTSGWTSFNARVAGAVAAKRLLRAKQTPMCSNESIYNGIDCITLSRSALNTVYEDFGCCFDDCQPSLHNVTGTRPTDFMNGTDTCEYEHMEIRFKERCVNFTKAKLEMVYRHSNCCDDVDCKVVFS